MGRPRLRVFTPRVACVGMIVAACAGLMAGGAAAADTSVPSAPTAAAPEPPASAPDKGPAADPKADAKVVEPTKTDAAAPAEQVTLSQQINDMVRVRETVEALDRPDPAGKALGRLRPGVKIKAIGVVEGGKWVQIELPNKNTAFVPIGPLAIGENATELPKLSGPVTGVPNAASLVIDKQTIRLSGIDPGPPGALGAYESWVKGHGVLACEPVADTGRYRCLTSTGVDVAEAAILNGAGRVGDGASAVYREREKAAREQKKGLWGAN